MAPGSFSSTQGEPLSQLSFAEVQQHATGTCFCSPQQVAPFLSNFKSISVDALALLTTTALPQEMTGSSPISAIRYPALYTPTGEAVLVSGSMVQLGDESVQLTPAPIDEVEQIDTCVFKISVYRDQSVIPWERLAEAPMRALMTQHPELTMRKQAGCRQDPSCPRFHPAVEESVEQLFLDLWGRQYQKLGGGRDSPGHAQVYQVFVRVPSSAMAHFQRLSLPPGVYCEPRSPNRVGTHPGFAVVWLPNADADKALHAMRICDRALSIARLGHRFGIRVKESDEQQTHEALQPGHQFLKVKVAAKYRLHPLPFGTQRSSLIQMLQQWK